MKTHTLERTGRPPLRFTGRAVKTVDGRTVAGRDQLRYHTLTLYETGGGQYVLAISYTTLWEGELSHHDALQVDAGTIEKALADYDPTAHVQGFPDRPEFAVRQASLLAWIRRCYESHVSELLRDCPELATRIE